VEPYHQLQQSQKYMKHHVSDQATVAAVFWSISLGKLRQHVLAVFVSNTFFLEVEQLRANHSEHGSEDMARLTRWHVNMPAEIAHREADTARQNVQATLRPFSFRRYYSRKPQPTPAWAPGAPLPDYADRHASIFDRRVAARFVPEQSLTLANLLTCARP
jgi:hypothetical protein